MVKKQPTGKFPILRFGASVELQSVGVLAQMLGMPDRTAKVFLQSIRVPIVHLGTESYFSIYSLETAMFIIADFQGPGLYAHGSNGKRRRTVKKEFKQEGSGNYPTELRPMDVPKDLRKLSVRMERAGKARVDKITRDMVKLFGKRPRTLTRKEVTAQELGGGESTGGGDRTDG